MSFDKASFEDSVEDSFPCVVLVCYQTEMPFVGVEQVLREVLFILEEEVLQVVGCLLWVEVLFFSQLENLLPLTLLLALDDEANVAAGL